MRSHKDLLDVVKSLTADAVSCAICGRPQSRNVMDTVTRDDFPSLVPTRAGASSMSAISKYCIRADCPLKGGNDGEIRPERLMWFVVSVGRVVGCY